MIRTILALTAGIALAAAPAAGQDQHQQHHPAGTDSTSMMTSGMMMACPFLQGADRGAHPMAMMGQGAMGQGMMGMMGQGMMGESMMGHGMMGMATWGPGSLLAVREELGLTETQIDDLEELQEQAREEARSHMELAHEARARAMDLLGQEPVPFDGYEMEIRAAVGHLAEAQVAVTRAGVEALGLLTAEQREDLSSLLPGMHHGSSDQGMTMRGRGHGDGSVMRHPGGLR